MIIQAIAFTSLLLMVQAPADEGSEAAATQVQSGAELEKANADDEIICRRQPILGSRFTKRICGTRKEWETLARDSEMTAQNWQRRGKGLEPTDTNKPGG